MCYIRNKWPTDGWDLVNETMCVVPLLPCMVSVVSFIHCELQIACFVRMKTLVSMVAFAPTWGTASTPVTVPWGITVPTVKQVSAWSKNWSMYETWVVVPGCPGTHLGSGQLYRYTETTLFTCHSKHFLLLRIEQTSFIHKWHYLCNTHTWHCTCLKKWSHGLM